MRWPATRIAFVLAEILLLASVPALAFKGFEAVLDTTAGTAVDPELDPDEPGYEAFLQATPVLVMLGRTDAGELSWATAAALSGGSGRGGSLLFVPVATVVPTGEGVEHTVGELDAADGVAAAGQGVSDILGAGATEVVEVAADRLQSLVAPVAPLEVANPDELDGFPAGPLTLAAEQAGPYLDAIGVGESDLTRLSRHETFWRGWLAAIESSADPEVVPGEAESGIGRFVRGLAGGPVSFDVPPVVAEVGADGLTRFRADPIETLDLVEDRIAFPAPSRPGFRTRVRVLDGAGADGLALRTARDVVRAGGQVVVVGNADRFDAATTEVFYFDERFADRAGFLALAFGVEAQRLEGPNTDDQVDVTVVAGADRLVAYGLEPREPTTNGDDAG